MHHGRDVLHEVAAFARDGVKSINLHALSPADFQNIIHDGELLNDTARKIIEFAKKTTY